MVIDLDRVTNLTIARTTGKSEKGIKIICYSSPDSCAQLVEIYISDKQFERLKKISKI